jgi:tRNA pseudouridine13 synthase
MELLKESSVGISCFMSSFKGFSGIIKHRYNDFHVYEINNDLEQVHLTALSRPLDPVPERVPDSVLFDKVKDLCPGLDLESLKDLLDLKSSVGLNTPPILTKPSRTEFHTVIRELSNGKLDTRTVDDNSIKITLLSTKNPSKRRLDWSKGDYTHFTLYKENKDTMDAVSILAGLMRINSKAFTFCGTKDKRAITTQRVCGYRVDPDKLLALNSRLRGLKVGNVKVEKDKLMLGDSKGNHFVIVLRQVFGSKSEILNAIDSLSSTGFINYFGMQRFGTRQVSTHQIGISILRGDWEKSVDLIIGSSSDPDSRQEIMDARREWEKMRDPLKTLKLFPKFCTGERALLESLLKQTKDGRLDYLEAINQIPRNLKSMYLHAYQSRVWNEMTSLRHIKYGCKLVKGDIVRLPSDDDQEGFRGLGNVKVIEDDIDLDTYTYLDLVLPLPGHAVTYPSNEIGKAYKEFMALDGFDPEDMKRKQPDFSLPGL